MLIFFLLLTLGFAYELGKNALTIYSKQYNKSNIHTSSFNYLIIFNNIYHITLTVYSFFFRLDKTRLNNLFLTYLINNKLGIYIYYYFFNLVYAFLIDKLREFLINNYSLYYYYITTYYNNNKT